jgi:hypothetical protein
VKAIDATQLQMDLAAKSLFVEALWQKLKNVVVRTNSPSVKPSAIKEHIVPHPHSDFIGDSRPARQGS